MFSHPKISNAPQVHCYTAVLRPDPPDIAISKEGEKALRKLADQVGQLDGFQELERDERSYQIELHLRCDE
jgi:hypothetical protein